MTSKEIAKYTLLFFVFIFLTSVIFYSMQLPLKYNPVSLGTLQASASDAVQPLEQQEVINITAEPEVKENIQEVSDEVSAKSAISVELSGYLEENILFEKSIDEKLPIASLVKLMTALVVLKSYNLDQEISISKSAMAQVGEQGELKEGEVLSVKNLLYITLIESSNRAAYALSEAVGKDEFVSLMNNESGNLGLEDTYFEDSTGLSDKSYSTAEDLAKLSKHLFLNYPLFREIIGLKEFNLYLPDGSIHHKIINTNELLGQNEIIGGKTGYTYVAQGCFMAIQRKFPEKYIIHIILGAEDRVLEMKKLIEKSSGMKSYISFTTDTN